MFYENFKKKVENHEIKDKKIYIYGINFRKRALWFIFSISMFIFSLYSFYIYANTRVNFYLLIGAVLFLVFVTFFQNLISYKIKIDRDKGEILLKKEIVKIEEIEKATLRFIIPPGKKYPEKCLDIVTKERVRIVVPLIMSRSVDFIKVTSVILGEKFAIE